MSLYSNKFYPVINIAFLSGIILVSDCGCNAEDNNIFTMLYDKMLYIYKTVKSSHLKKLKIIYINLIFHVVVAWDCRGDRVKGGGRW